MTLRMTKLVLEPNMMVTKIKQTKKGHTAPGKNAECFRRSHAMCESHVTQHGELANNVGELCGVVRVGQVFHIQSVRSLIFR